MVMIKENFAWVWYSFLYWINPSFTNHLKFRWYHYKFCQKRAEVFLFQTYLEQWRNYIDEMLTKHPGKIIPSHGLHAILEIMRENKLEKLFAFLESQDIEQGTAIFIKELNGINNSIPGNLNVSPPSKQDELSPAIISDAAEIHGRTWVIAMRIYYEQNFSLK